MLALTRRLGERIVINDNIILTVVDIRGDHVRLGIEAPKEIKIYRGEIYADIEAENRKAAAPLNIADVEALKKVKK